MMKHYLLSMDEHWKVVLLLEVLHRLLLHDLMNGLSTMESQLAMMTF